MTNKMRWKNVCSSCGETVYTDKPRCVPFVCERCTAAASERNCPDEMGFEVLRTEKFDAMSGRDPVWMEIVVERAVEDPRCEGCPDFSRCYMPTMSIDNGETMGLDAAPRLAELFGELSEYYEQYREGQRKRFAKEP